MAAAQAIKKSKILQHVARRESGRESGLVNRSSQMDQMEHWSSKRIRLPAELPLGAIAKISKKRISLLLPLGVVNGFVCHSKAPSTRDTGAFHTSHAMSAASTSIVTPSSSPSPSPQSSLDSPDRHPLCVSTSEAEETRELTAVSSSLKGVMQSRLSISDGYEASGGGDSDWISSRIVQRSTNWKY